MGKMTGQEYVQYLTEQFVEYIEKPSKDRKKEKTATAHKEQWLTKWFGVGGTSLLLWLRKRQSAKKL